MVWLSSIASNVLLASPLALGAWFVQRRLQRPALARVLWLLVLVKLVTPPLVSVELSALSGAIAPRDAGPTGDSPADVRPALTSSPLSQRVACATGICGCSLHARRPWGLFGLWSLGAGAALSVAWCRWARFRSLLAHAAPAPAEWQSLAARLCAELSIRRPPQVLTVPGPLPPLVVAGRRGARLLLPRDLIDSLSEPQRAALLLHELVHIRRCDHLVRMLEFAVNVAYWWLPPVRAIGRQLRECEEACCDAAVVARLPQARRDYARLLLDVLDFASPNPAGSLPQATAMSAARDLEQRLRSILDAGPAAGRGLRAGACVSAGCLVAACAILPCGFRYDFAARPTPAAIPVEQEPNSLDALGKDAPDANEFRLLPDDRVRDRPWSAACCPS